MPFNDSHTFLEPIRDQYLMFNKLINAMQRTGNERLRIYLLSMSDDFLIQYGYSRELLLRGVDAWPWSMEEQPVVIKTPTVRKNKKAKAQTQKQLHDALEPLDWVA